MAGAHRLFRDRVRITNYRDGVPNRRGQATETESYTVETWGLLTQRGSRELETDATERGHYADDWIVLLAAGEDVQAGARLEIAGRTFDADGEPIVMRAPVGMRDRFTQVALTAVSPQLRVPRGA